ncbi:MAG TPA: DUF929 family protein [Frankiaceae bacterium]|jgi:thiol-disulfide isomerase/thioredoxin|nr:DUF929 family protein [Frankiaceae bacterium]
MAIHSTEPPKAGHERASARERASAARELQRKRDSRRRMLIIGGICGALVAVVAVMVILYATKSEKKVATSSLAPAAAVKSVTTVAASTYDKVDTSKVVAGPKKVSGSALTFNGKPGIYYQGAEYCPFCAAERWPLVVALSRFGTFSNLSQTVSGAAPEPYPATPTFSFVASSYSSPYLAFQAVETQTNQKKNGQYTPLQTPTAAQEAIIAKYGSGSVPFLDFGNKYTIEGASYSSAPLVGKSFDEIAAAVADPNSEVGKSVLGTANLMTAMICDVTGGKPGSVCNDSTITKLRSILNAEK